MTCSTSDCPFPRNAFVHGTSFEPPYRPRSPLSLAISSILALVPHPEDSDPSSEESIALRRTYSHTFAQMANLNIEADCERDTLSRSPLTTREPFHAYVPIDLEKILALLVLSIYEYTQRGNLTKMRYRAGQALTMALDMGIHSLGEENTKFAEAQRRAWWMTVRAEIFTFGITMLISQKTVLLCSTRVHCQREREYSSTRVTIPYTHM